MSPATTDLRAPAKLTLSLRIVGVREDGFHLIDAEMVSLDLADSLLVAGPVPPGVDRPRVTHLVDGDLVPAGADDLVVRALDAVGSTSSVTVTKRIPAGAGLGGGSSDAAAILRWAGMVDVHLAAALGADVPFCVTGGRARVGGIGEIVSPLPFIEQTFTLLTPPVHCSTPVVYRSWDALGGPRGDNGNDLEPAALHAYPEIAHWREELAAVTGLRPRLAGSGSSWFVEGDWPGPGRRVLRTIPGQ